VKPVFILFLLFATTCLAQDCVPEPHPQVDSAYGYVRAEIKGLQSIRLALLEEQKIPAPAAPTDPDRAKKAADRNKIAKGLAKYFDCATRMVTPYRESKNKRVQESVESILSGIKKTTDVNAQVLEALAIVDTAPSADKVDPATMKKLSDLTKDEDNARALIMGGVKMSTFAITKEKIVDEDTEPYAFSITAKQRDSLLADARELAKRPNPSAPKNYIDGCAEILLTTLNRKLPISGE
jgi:hypothetical protein